MKPTTYAEIVLGFYAKSPEYEYVFEVYDNDECFAEAMNTLVPNFEYPDWSHLTIKEALRKIRHEYPNPNQPPPTTRRQDRRQLA